MARSLLERRLVETSAELQRNLEELHVTNEQLLVIRDQADQARLRALVSETPLAQREHVEAQRHVELLSRRQIELHSLVSGLEMRQDQLLDRISSEL